MPQQPQRIGVIVLSASEVSDKETHEVMDQITANLSQYIPRGLIRVKRAPNLSHSWRLMMAHLYMERYK